MTFRVLKAFKGRTENGQREIKPNMIVNLPKTEAIRLLNKGQIEPAERMALKIYSEVLQDFLWVVYDRADMDRLRARGISEPIYTSTDIRLLKGKHKDHVRAVHEAKTIFPRSIIEDVKHDGERER